MEALLKWIQGNKEKFNKFRKVEKRHHKNDIRTYLLCIFQSNFEKSDFLFPVKFFGS